LQEKNTQWFVVVGIRKLNYDGTNNSAYSKQAFFITIIELIYYFNHNFGKEYGLILLRYHVQLSFIKNGHHVVASCLVIEKTAKTMVPLIR
jgi:hypothetical protein